MTKTSAHTLSPRNSQADTKSAPSHSPDNTGPVTLGLAITMAWQLAFVVIAPIIAGHALDTTFDSSMYTFIGMAVAMIGMILVVRNTVKEMNKAMGSRDV